jgi:hypothetical protein
MSLYPIPSSSIWRAVLAWLRGDATLVSTVTGGFHDRFAPEKAKYPLVIGTLHPAPYEYTWGSVMVIAELDLFAFSENRVDASNADRLLAARMHDAALAVEGQSTLICRRVRDLPMPPDLDLEGRKVYQIGGTYEVWTDQPI